MPKQFFSYPPLKSIRPTESKSTFYYQKLGHNFWRNLMLIVFSVLLTYNANANTESNRAAKLVPIIMLLLEDTTLRFRIGQINSHILTSVQNPNGVVANFDNVNSNLNLSLTVSGLAPGQSIQVILNGRVLDTIGYNANSNNYNISLPFTDYLELTNGGDNVLEFKPSSNNAVWAISNIQILHQAGPLDRKEAVRFLTKATFGANESSINRLLQLGYESWVDEQLRLSPTLHLPFYQQAVIDREAAGIVMGASQQCASKSDAWWNGAIKGSDQLRQRMAFALSQIFVVDDGGCEISRDGHLNYYDILIKHSFGSYRELLEDVTINPIMASFLSLRGSQPFSDRFNTSPDENYAREVMQLFTIGLTELNINGTEKLDNGRPIETFGNEIVLDMARALTGWQWESGRAYPGVSLIPMEPWSGLWSRFHDHDEKKILNDVTIPAGDRLAQTGNNILDDLKIVLDTLTAHDNVAPFISKQLIQRFVTSNPSPEYIERVATVFNNNGSGVKGDLSAVIKAILLDPDSIDSHLVINGGKLKEPLMRVSQIWRAFNAKSPIKYIRFMHTDRFLGQKPMASGSVFNFYRPDFAPLGEISDNDLVAPEFKLLDDAQNIQLYFYMQRILSSNVTVDDNLDYSPAFNALMTLNLTTAKSISDSTPALLNYLNELLFGGLMSDGLRDRVAQYVDDDVSYSDNLSTDERREKKVEEALLLLGVSPEYNVQQ
jgi:uncharacterized protein (DUF1800 family)